MIMTDADPWAALDGRLFATVPEAAAILRYDARTVRRGDSRRRDTRHESRIDIPHPGVLAEKTSRRGDQ